MSIFLSYRKATQRAFAFLASTIDAGAQLLSCCSVNCSAVRSASAILPASASVVTIPWSTLVLMVVSVVFSTVRCASANWLEHRKAAPILFDTTGPQCQN